MARDFRSPEATQYRTWYKTSTWKQIRRKQLANHPLCAMCQQERRTTPATICDHIKAHRGDWSLFFSGPFQSLCKPCHDRHAQHRDRTGNETRVTGLDGWPVQT